MSMFKNTNVNFMQFSTDAEPNEFYKTNLSINEYMIKLLRKKQKKATF